MATDLDKTLYIILLINKAEEYALIEPVIARIRAAHYINVCRVQVQKVDRYK